MAVESVTVVAPEVRVGPFVLSKGTGHKHPPHRKTDAVLFVTLFRSVVVVFRRPGGADK